MEPSKVGKKWETRYLYKALVRLSCLRPRRLQSLLGLITFGCLTCNITASCYNLYSGFRGGKHSLRIVASLPVSFLWKMPDYIVRAIWCKGGYKYCTCHFAVCFLTYIHGCVWFGGVAGYMKKDISLCLSLPSLVCFCLSFCRRLRLECFVWI